MRTVTECDSVLPAESTGFKVDAIAKSQGMQEVLEFACRFSQSAAPVLVTGESGTGKEVVARLVHQQSQRRDQGFVRVNCAALSESLFESELFGHERGAFTGASDRRIGRFELASQGTLLLDEISEIPTRMQAKLLRVLEAEEFQRVGGNDCVQMTARIIATSNRLLENEVEDGNFREDLFYRLNILNIEIPPLRERVEDIPVLANFFLKQFRDEGNVAVQQLTDGALRKLCDYEWPGNVRQLRNIIRRSCLLAQSDIIDSIEFPKIERSQQPLQILDMTLKGVERFVIEKTLQRFDGNKTAAADHLGVTARTIHNKLKEYSAEEN